MKRVVVEEPGGPEQLRLVESATPEPGPGEALIAIAASGVNFIDVYSAPGCIQATDRSRSAARRPAWSSVPGPASRS